MYHNTQGRVSPISVWAQIPLFVLPAAGEVFANVTSYELAYTLAPQRMKGLVFAIVLFMSALSSAIVEIISPSVSNLRPSPPPPPSGPSLDLC